ncbi:cytosolic sulfotransferase 12-like [Triticum dicoccoides]|uniref:cytosolic sulfotransferase 12-like n=1 Tax=Triticum dicoccoides TaxID=85692 RepID=UPI000E78FF36|nr:cytosolic sulfotransferase 12-like [Triticum dicoccoides]
MARGAYPPADAQHPLLHMNPHECVPFMDELFTTGQEARLEALPSPRLMNTHTHHSLLPASVTDYPDYKIVFICREPKDMLVSLWHFLKGVRSFTFVDLFDAACEGRAPNGPIWDHLIRYWNTSKTSLDKILFLRYEEMLIDPVGHVRKLARFIGQPFSQADEAAEIPADIVKLCSFDKLKGLGVNKAGSFDGKVFNFSHESFFRKGVAEDWVNNMTSEMAQRFDTIIEDKLRGSGLTFK